MVNRPDIETVRNRLAAAVTASGRAVSEIENASGLKRDQLRDFLARRKDGLNLVSAAAVAIELGLSLEWLADMPGRQAGAIGQGCAP
jgi:hypothetical protein